MIKKILIFGDFKTLESMPLKSASISRIAYALRKKNFEVKQIHHCTNFSYDELNKIVSDFSNNEEILICVSTSFLAGVDRKNKKFKLPSKEFEDITRVWGLKTILFLLNIGKICEANNFKYILGGWEITSIAMKRKKDIMGFDLLSKYVTYFVIGNNPDIIEKICNEEPLEISIINGKPILRTDDLFDFSDCASTYILDDKIFPNESICTEVAAGCIFSCSFCDYAALGKKKNEYTRSYDSFEKEIIENHKNFNIDFYTLTDNIVNDTPEKIRYLIDVRNKTGIDFKWTGYARLDTIRTKEQAILLKESGMIGANFGIESLYKESGPFIGKVTDKVRLLKSLEILRDVFEDEAIFTGLFIAGLPKEPISHMIETYEWLNSIEGRYYLDHYAYTAFVLYVKNKDKNEINKSRNDPFKDYVLPNDNPRNWTSPWSSYEEVLELSRTFTMERANRIGGAFSLPYLYNSGYDIKTLIKDIRESGKKGLPFRYDIQKPFNEYLDRYKKSIL